MTKYRRVESEKHDDAAAAVVSLAIAAGVGLVTFYLTRAFLAREALPEPAPSESTDVARR